MAKFYFSFVVAVILILTATLVHSQNYPTRMGKGKSIFTKTDGVVLYEQMANFGSNGITSQNFDTTYDIYDNQAADDFIVPAGDHSWTIESIEVLGIYFSGTGPANSVNVWFYNDSGGFPGTLAESRMDVIPTGGLSTGSFIITFPSPITLQANTYWLSVQCNMDSAVGGQWGWTEQQQSNLESTWQNPGGGWATSCATWGYRVTNCNIGAVPFNDLSFRLNGFKGDPCPVEVASNPIPANDTTDVPINEVSLGWTNGGGTANVEVWFGPNARVLKLYDGLAITSWPLGTLSKGTLYRWYIISKDDNCAIQSPSWTFTTKQDTNIIIDTVDVYPQNSVNWTGTCNSSSKTQYSLVHGIGNEVGWMDFDVTSIPDTVTINSVKFYGYLYDNSWPYWSITPMGSINPVTDGASVIYNHISTNFSQGIAYSYNIETGTLNNDWQTRVLGTTAVSDLQNALIRNWFALGILDFDFSTSYFIKFQGWAEANKPYLRVIYSYVGATTFQLSLNIDNGWNMVSIPGLLPTNQNVNTWWQYRDPAANVFRYVSGSGYQATNTAIPGKGYWMKNSGDRTYNTGDEWPAEGIKIIPHDPINVTSGWNLFGVYEEVVAAAGLTSTPPGLFGGPVYGFSGGYFIPTNLEPGYGYWVKLTGAGQINIPDGFAKENREAVDWFPSDWGKIVITDATGINYTLYSVKGEVNLDNYELPPAPPTGIFDIRFSSGRIAEDINSSVKSIDMSGVTYPLTVRAEGMDMRLMDETGKTLNVNLKSGEEVVISDATIQKLMVTSELIPAVYALEQNYPNPFNPSTVIEFSLPEDVSNVKLSIYNALGEKVAELVNTGLTAGKYSYQWNAKNVATGMSARGGYASGVYIYELRTDKFVSVKKMVLLK
jgi:hypothetical protein